MVGRSPRERRNLRRISAYSLCSFLLARNSAATVRSAWDRADALRPDRSAITRLRSGPVASPRRVPFAVRSATAAVFRAGGTAHGRPLVRLVVAAAPRPARRRRLRRACAPPGSVGIPPVAIRRAFAAHPASRAVRGASLLLAVLRVLCAIGPAVLLRCGRETPAPTLATLSASRSHSEHGEPPSRRLGYGGFFCFPQPPRWRLSILCLREAW